VTFFELTISIHIFTVLELMMIVFECQYGSSDEYARNLFEESFILPDHISIIERIPLVTPPISLVIYYKWTIHWIYTDKTLSGECVRTLKEVEVIFELETSSLSLFWAERR
jgi:hypothetical protein